MNIIYIKTKKELDNLGSALTWEGMNLESLDNVIEWMKDNGAEFTGDNVFVTLGKVMNSIDGLHGDNAYPDDLNIVSFRLEDIDNWNNLVIPRFEVRGRWLDDIRDNNKRRENH